MIDYTKTRWAVIERNPLRMSPKPTAFLYPEIGIAVIEHPSFKGKPARQDRVMIDDTFETKLDALMVIEKELIAKLNPLSRRLDLIRKEIEKENANN